MASKYKIALEVEVAEPQQSQRCTGQACCFGLILMETWRVNALSGGANGISSDSSGVLLISDLQSPYWTASKLKWI